MKKLFALCVLLAFVCGMAFADEDEGEDQQFLYVQVGASVMYKQPINYTFSSLNFLYNFRAGVTADVLFSLGILEIGAEIGVYGMEDADYGFFILELPIDALVRLNFTKDRSIALEVRGGGWFITALGYYNEFGFNGGARIVLGSFYLGGDYIATSFFYPAWAVEAGVKFSF